MPENGTDNTKGYSAHNDQWLQIGFGRYGQQGIDTEQGEGKTEQHTFPCFSLFITHAGAADTQVRIALHYLGNKVGKNLIGDPGGLYQLFVGFGFDFYSALEIDVIGFI